MTDMYSKLEAVRLDRADRYEKTSKNLMRLAWSIECVAVFIGLSIAFARVADANQTNTANVSFWGAIQLMGGFIIVSMGELTKIPLSMLLVNVRLTFKPLVLLVILFVSGITFETVFLSLERGYNYQKSDIHEYRDELRVAREEIDTAEERKEIERIESQIRSEQADLDQLVGDNASNLAFIKRKYSGDGDAAKPNEYDSAEKSLQDLQADLAQLSSDYQAKVDILTAEMTSAAAIYDTSGALRAASLNARTPELVAFDESVELFKAQKKSLEDELAAKLKNIQDDYDKKRISFQQGIESATSRGDTKEAARYQTLIERLAPRTESQKVENSLIPQIEELNAKISVTISEREQIALRDARAKGLIVTEADNERTIAIEEIRRVTSEQRDALTRAMQVRREALSKKLSEAQLRLDTLNDTWRQNRDAGALKSVTAKKQEIEGEMEKYLTVQAAKRAVIEDLRSAQLRLSWEIRTAEKSAPELQTDIGEKQRLLCDALLGNQIFRISTRFDASALFGVERSPEDASLVGKPDVDCPAQIHVDEANADRVAFIWFGSIALLAATAGAVTAIAAQGFLRMAEALRWQPPQELNARKGLLSGSLRRALVKWRWRRVKTIEVERIKEVQVEVVKPYETIREIQNVIREIVPVPVFVPTGGDVEAEMAKVRSSYEEMNRLAREAAVPPQTTIFADALPSSPEATANVHSDPVGATAVQADNGGAEVDHPAEVMASEPDEVGEGQSNVTPDQSESSKYGETKTAVETTA
jgi:hypothetical protein